MGESYPGRDGEGATFDADSAFVREARESGEPPPDVAVIALTGDLLQRLLPGSDSSALAVALLAERDTGSAPVGAAGSELARVRALIARGDGARELQHALNNPLTALLAEAQLLQLEDLPKEGRRAAVDRIVGLARRLAALTRQLPSDAAGPLVG